jgi:hypothetical protein
MTAPTLRTARRLRRQRGAAAVEAVIVATFFVVIFACMWGAVKFHHEKIRVMKVARAQAWGQAVDACQGGGDVLDDLAANGTTSGAAKPPNTDNDYANVEDSKLTKDSGYASVQVAGSATMPGLIGGTSYVPTGRMKIRCNEDPPPETLMQKAKKAMDILVGIAGF